MARPARNARLVARTREAILDGATTAFAQHGYHATTVKDIASAAGYTAPSLYNYFGSKEEIFTALLERIHGVFMGTFDEPVPSGLSFAQRLELLLHRHNDERTRHAEAFAVFMRMQNTAMPTESLAVWRKQAFESYLGRLTRWVDESASADDLGPYDAETLAYQLWGTMMAAHVRELLGRAASPEQRPDPQQQVAQIIALFLHGAAGGP